MNANEAIERTIEVAADHLIEHAEREECVAELLAVDCHAALQDAGMSSQEAEEHCAALKARLADYVAAN